MRSHLSAFLSLPEMPEKLHPALDAGGQPGVSRAWISDGAGAGSLSPRRCVLGRGVSGQILCDDGGVRAEAALGEDEGDVEADDAGAVPLARGLELEFG